MNKLLGFSLVLLLMSGCSAGLKVSWEDFEVEVIKAERPEDPDLLHFKDSSTGALRYVVEVEQKVLDQHVIQVGKGEGFGLLAHSGGESGGFIMVSLFFIDDNGFQRVDLPGFSGYNSIKFTDINHDGKSEILANSEAFSGYITQYNEAILTLVRATYMGGISSLPEIYSWEADEEGYNVIQVTFDPPYREFLENALREFRSEIDLKKGQSLEIYPDDSDFLTSLITYYHYVSRIRGAEAALAEANTDDIRLKLPDGPQIPLAQLLNLQN